MNEASRLYKRIQISESGCWDWMGSINGNGYGTMAAWGKSEGVHRVMWIITKGSIPEGKRVLHRCDNRRCCNPKHLRLGTQSDNIKEMDQKGRRATPWAGGEQIGTSKLTVPQVIAIRADSRPRYQVAADYGVTPECIGLIVNRRSWRHVPG
jgi:hypothetical protein